MGRHKSLEPKNLPYTYTCNVCSTVFELRLLGEMTVHSAHVPGHQNSFHHSILAGICQKCALSHSINSVAAVLPKPNGQASDKEETDS